MYNENAEHGEFLHQFPSLLGSRSQLISKVGFAQSLIRDRLGEPATVNVKPLS